LKGLPPATREIIEAEMIGEISPVRVDPSTADSDFWKRYHVLRRIRHAETRPDDPLEPDDVAELRMTKPDPFDDHQYFEISRDGVMLGWFGGECSAPESPEYPSSRHLFWANAYVRADQRRRGVASSFLPVMARLMHELGRTTVGMYADQDPGHEFLKWLRAEPKLSDIESRLKLSEVDWDLMRRWVDQGASRSPQTRLEIYDGSTPEEMWPDYAVRRSVMLNTIPLESLDFGEIVITPDRIRDWYARMEERGEVSHEVLTRELDGSITGMTDVTWAPYRRTLIEQQFTGVLPGARGRGIGKWIKAAMLLHVRELYPDAQWVVTYNAHSNAPMLGINRAIGFATYRTGTEYQMTLDQLEARIDSD
jgi:GNAT superfamily N-acetyltransferase